MKHASFSFFHQTPQISQNNSNNHINANNLTIKSNKQFHKVKGPIDNNQSIKFKKIKSISNYFKNKVILKL